MPWKEIDVMNQRAEFVMKALRADNFRALCAEYGISAKTGYKWLERFKQHGWGGLSDESRRPDGHAQELAQEVVCEIVRLKKLRPAWGPKKIRAIYARTHTEVPSESSFKRVLDRAGWVEHRRTRKRESSGRLFAGRKATRPNEVWTVDFKGWWYGGPGHRCEPLTVRDEYSRYVLELRALSNAKTETVRACFEHLFTEHGLPGAIRSDNGSPFASRVGLWGLTRLSAWWLVLGIDLERNRPGCPQDNPAHERFHLDVAREIEGIQSSDQQAFLEEWRQHTTMNGRTKRLPCGRRPNSFRNQKPRTTARPRTSITARCATSKSAPRAPSHGGANGCSSPAHWPGGPSVSNRLAQANTMFGSADYCSGSLMRRR
jgi:putative transposase